MKFIAINLFLVLLAINISYAEKKLWAISFLGKKAPEFVVEEWLSEKPDFSKDKFILIDFWATWCGPCVNAVPKLNSWHKEFGKSLLVIGVSGESKERVKGFKEHKIAYYNAIDTKKTMHKKLGVKGIPHVIIVNPKGFVVWEGYPFLKGHELTKEVIRKLLVQK